MCMVGGWRSRLSLHVFAPHKDERTWHCIVRNIAGTSNAEREAINLALIVMLKSGISKRFSLLSSFHSDFPATRLQAPVPG